MKIVSFAYKRKKTFFLKDLTLTVSKTLAQMVVWPFLRAQRPNIRLNIELT